MTPAQMAEEIRQLKAMVNQLSSRLQAPGTGASASAVAPSASGGRAMTAPPTGGSTAPGFVLPNIQPGATAPSNIPNVATAVAPSRSGGVGAPGQSLPPNPAPVNRFDSPSTLQSLSGNFRFGPGFELRSDDNEYIFQFHDLTQVDYRGYLHGGQTTIHDTFDIPRQWFMFSGRITKPVGYFVSLANGFDTVTGLDMFLDIDLDPKFRLRVGRYKTPFTYEFLVEPIQGLVTPERSIFFNNFGQNRDEGIMAFGRMFQNKFDYATGIFNGSRNAYIANQNQPAVSGFVNYRPFADEEETLLENFNIGGSVFASDRNQVPVPQTFRTVVPTTGNALLGVPFLGLNNNVREQGQAAFWDLHMAYFYGGLAVISEWQSGFQDYALTSNLHQRTKLPVESFYVQASYLLTGETRSSIGIVKPLNPVKWGKAGGSDSFGVGAWEPYFKYEFIDIGNQVFSSGLSDPNLWANRVFQTHTGINWHLTQYIKMYFDWNHAEFNRPVVLAPGKGQKTSDLFFVRLQLYF
jgi:phosphate-selective porin OprO/OprP